MQHLNTGHFSAYEINFNMQTHGEKKWHALYKYPVIGGAVWYADLANPDMLGKAVAVYPYMNFHLYHSKCFYLNYRFGLGLGYISKPFDYIDNYKNIAIGSRLNAAINMFYELKWFVAKKISLTSGIGLTHFSNGSFKTPNLGINIPTVFAGIAYYLPYSENIIADTSWKQMKGKKSSLRLLLAGGMKQIYPAEGDTYGVFMISLNYTKALSYKREFAVGMDVFLDYSDKRSIKRKDIPLNSDFGILKPGVYAGHNFIFSRLHLLMHFGYYLYAKDKSDGMIYSRFGLEYDFSRTCFARLALKTHFGKADFVEWGIGYRFLNKKNKKIYLEQ
ncbi:MAG: acyloxyacyl hydrolase [Bacteroidota bacterium]